MFKSYIVQSLWNRSAPKCTAPGGKNHRSPSPPQVRHWQSASVNVYGPNEYIETRHGRRVCDRTSVKRSIRFRVGEFGSDAPRPGTTSRRTLERKTIVRFASFGVGVVFLARYRTTDITPRVGKIKNKTRRSFRGYDYTFGVEKTIRFERVRTSLISRTRTIFIIGVCYYLTAAAAYFTRGHFAILSYWFYCDECFFYFILFYFILFVSKNTFWDSKSA